MKASGLMDDTDPDTPNIIEIPLKQLTVNVELGTSSLKLDEIPDGLCPENGDRKLAMGVHGNGLQTGNQLQVLGAHSAHFARSNANQMMSDDDSSSPESDDSLLGGSRFASQKSLPTSSLNLSNPALVMSSSSIRSIGSSRGLDAELRPFRRSKPSLRSVDSAMSAIPTMPITSSANPVSTLAITQRRRHMFRKHRQRTSEATSSPSPEPDSYYSKMDSCRSSKCYRNQRSFSVDHGNLLLLPRYCDLRANENEQSTQFRKTSESCQSLQSVRFINERPYRKSSCSSKKAKQFHDNDGLEISMRSSTSGSIHSCLSDSLYNGKLPGPPLDNGNEKIDYGNCDIEDGEGFDVRDGNCDDDVIDIRVNTVGDENSPSFSSGSSGCGTRPNGRGEKAIVHHGVDLASPSRRHRTSSSTTGRFDSDEEKDYLLNLLKVPPSGDGLDDDGNNNLSAGASASICYSNKALLSLPKAQKEELARSLLQKKRSYQDNLYLSSVVDQSCAGGDEASAGDGSSFCLDSVSKEELLVLWKSSELDLNRRLEMAIREKARLEKRLALLQKHHSPV